MRNTMRYMAFFLVVFSTTVVAKTVPNTKAVETYKNRQSIEEFKDEIYTYKNLLTKEVWCFIFWDLI